MARIKIERPVLTLRPERAAEAGRKILDIFEREGIFGFKVTPQHVPPQKAITPEEKLRFVTLTVSLDYLRDSYRLYDAGRKTFDDPETSWVYRPEEADAAGFKRVSKALKRHSLAQREVRDTDTWLQVCRTLIDRFDGSVENLIASADRNGPGILRTVREHGFNSLSGPKVGSLWLRMLNDSVVPIGGLEDIPIPVDRHVANATFALGAIEGEYDPNELEPITRPIHDVWFQGARDGGFRAIDLDVSLWYLGKLGCSKPEPCIKRFDCPVIDYCTHWRGV
jgi:hypothetical protein